MGMHKACIKNYCAYVDGWLAGWFLLGIYILSFTKG